MMRCESSTTTQRKSTRQSRPINTMRGTVTVKARLRKVKARNRKATMEISRARKIFTSFTLRLTKNLRLRRTQAATISTQRVTFTAQSRRAARTRNNKNNPRNNLVNNSSKKQRTTSMKESKVRRAITKTLTHLQSPENKKSSSTDNLETTLTFNKLKITGLTSRRAVTRFKAMLKDGLNVPPSLAIIIRRRNRHFMPIIVATLKKTSVRVGEQLFRTSTLRCSRFKTLTSLDKKSPHGRTTSLPTPKGNSTARLTNR